MGTVDHILKEPITRHPAVFAFYYKFILSLLLFYTNATCLKQETSIERTEIMHTAYPH